MAKSWNDMRVYALNLCDCMLGGSPCFHFLLRIATIKCWVIIMAAMILVRETTSEERLPVSKANEEAWNGDRSSRSRPALPADNPGRQKVSIHRRDT